ncbi:NAD-dependent epimerase/dehydratase family protein [Roseimaritima sediminicola]|uniref:NAD-dependent epimerase/dehydratase family protein n=1 Tax=Roseimaritima sediminicola TaxID=2662066 RepID=UPI0012983E9E|nr:NAD-dependent epimerase/dehydratase family protein [Roseimaritima sediminicola]
MSAANSSTASRFAADGRDKAKDAAGRALIVGCGYLGLRVADRLQRDGWHVAAVTRKSDRARQLAQQGIEPVRADWTDRASLRALPPHERILVAVAYDRDSGESRLESQYYGFRNLLRSTDPGADLCYISTTGVYHQDDGRWVDERSPCWPRSESAKVHLQAEGLLGELRGGGGSERRGDRGGHPWTVLRLAGIYGPGRVPLVRNVREGRPIPAAPEHYLNLIHVDDAAAAVLACWQAGPKQRRRYYVVSDGAAVRRRDFYGEVARLSGCDPPRFVAPEAGSSAGRRGGSNKRIWNARLRQDLLPRLQFADYRAGLRDILRAES